MHKNNVYLYIYMYIHIVISNLYYYETALVSQCCILFIIFPDGDGLYFNFKPGLFLFISLSFLFILKLIQSHKSVP